MPLRLDRTISTSTASGGGTASPLNLLFITAFALAITFLAQYLARRGGRGGRR